MKLLFTLASIAVFASVSNATVHTVTCQNSPSHFLPITVNAVVGDTIHWTWVAGVHDVGPISASDIPPGAAMWVEPIDIGNQSAEYVVTVAGNYHYVCHPSTPHAEDAYLVVTDPTGVQQYNAQSKASFAYPNPSNGIFEFVISGSQITKDSRLEIYDLQGQLVHASAITNARSKVDLSEQASGIYFARVYSGVGVLTKKIVLQ